MDAKEIGDLLENYILGRFDGACKGEVFLALVAVTITHAIDLMGNDQGFDFACELKELVKKHAQKKN